MRVHSTAKDLLQKGSRMLGRLGVFAAGPAWLEAVTPTADIYFLNAMRDLLSPEGGLTALGPNVYGTARRFVVLRYASQAELAALEARRPERVFYVIDDDLEALALAGELPAAYRSRLARFVATAQPRILALADTVLAPNPHLLAGFPGHRTEVLWPSHCSVCDDFGHFDRPDRVRLVFTGTRSHVPDLETITPALQRLCQLHAGLELTTFLGRWGPAPARFGPNLVNRKPLSWTAYRQLMASARFHIAVAPFRRVATNECRSHNKLHDHAAFGAAGLYGDILPYRQAIEDGRNGLLVAPDTDAWFDQMSRLVSDLAAARRLAEAGAALSRRLGNPQQLRAFWCEKLDLVP